MDQQVTMAVTTRVTTNVTAYVHDVETGELLDTIPQHNLVVDAGLALLAARIAGDTKEPITHFAVGTGTTEADALDTALEEEVFRGLVTQRTLSGATITIRYYLPSKDGNGSTITEVAMFNADTDGDMFGRAILSSSIAKTSAIAVTFAWEITFAAVA